MKNDDELKARSIELAERAFRLRDRAQTASDQEKLHATGDELINIENRERFYDAQRVMEIEGRWTEDQRSLAHEMSVADRDYRARPRLLFADAVELINRWFGQLRSTELSADDPRNILLHNAQVLSTGEKNNEYSDALGYLLSYVETILQQAHQDNAVNNEMADPFILNVRDVRDALLIERELSYDENKLLETYGDESRKIEAISIARHHLDELYADIKNTQTGGSSSP